MAFLQPVADRFMADAGFRTLLKQADVPATMAGFASNASALVWAVVAACAFGCWVGQVTTGWWSWVDRLWSVVPVVYAAIYAAYHPSNQRLTLMAALAFVWGLRLSFNFWRKGGYATGPKAEEDYRWPIIRDFLAKHDPIHPLGREVFSLTFVAVYQHILLWLIAGPQCFLASIAPDAGKLTTMDYGLAAAFLLALFLETLTDEQQWRFQSRKHAMTPEQRTKAGGDYARGFRTSGVFAYSRHLNFFCEQSMWWIFYGFTIASGAPAVNWSIVGPVLLTGLFQGSTWATELISVGKYPAYAAYQRTTSRLLPWLPGPSLDSPQGKQLVQEALQKAGKKSH